MRSVLLILLAFYSMVIYSQVPPIDSQYVSLDAFLDQVRQYHPVSAIAGLQADRGEAVILKAKGGFDPVAKAAFDQKYLDQTLYYRDLDAGVEIPTVAGLKLKAGYNRSVGNYVAPETSTTDAGLVYAGASLSLGRGLLIDTRRAQLRRAEIYARSTEAERRNLINELIYEAAGAYWDWYFAWRQVRVYEQALTAANARLAAVRGSVVGGDRPAVDTLEAGIQVQNRELSLQQALMQYYRAREYASAFLWMTEGVPGELTDLSVPYTPEAMPGPVVLQAGADSLIDRHPALLASEYEIQMLEVEQRLSREQLKPELDIEYNAINMPVNGQLFENYSIANYKWGVKFRMPIMLRKERGEVRLASLKIKEASNRLRDLEASLGARSAQAALTRDRTIEQVMLYSRTVEDMARLLDAERTMFETGESSLFMVNARELGYIGSQIKLIELRQQLRMAELETGYALGNLK